MYFIYKENIISTGSYGGIKLQPLFVTAQDRQKFDSIESKTKLEIISKIQDLLHVMPDSDIVGYYADTLKATKVKKKDLLIELFYEISSALDEQLANVVVGEIDSDSKIGWSNHNAMCSISL